MLNPETIPTNKCVQKTGEIESDQMFYWKKLKVTQRINSRFQF